MSGASGMAGTRRTMVFVWGGIGNMVMALPMLAALRRAAGDDAVALVTQHADMLELVDRERLPLAAALDDGRFAGPAGLFRLKRVLRGFSPALAVSSVVFPRRFGLLAGLSGARRRICEDDGRVVPFAEPVATRSRHAAQRNLELLRPLGITAGAVDHSLLRRDEHRPPRERLGIPAAAAIIGLFAGAGHPGRRWPAERFAAVGRALTNRGRLLVFADPRETASAEALAHRIGGEATVCAAPLPEKLALLADCRLFIGANTGLTHCAAALGTPVVELEGPTDPEVYRPLGPRVVTLRGAAPCAPCYRGGDRYGCRRRPAPCMTSITIDQVMDAVETQLSGPR